MTKPSLELSRMLRDLAPGDETQLHRIATMLAAGEVCTIMDSARFADRINPDDFAGMRNTAAAVRVAVAYGDLSGLVGCGYGCDRCGALMTMHEGRPEPTCNCDNEQGGDR